MFSINSKKSNINFWKDKIKVSGFRFTETRKAILYTFIENPGEYNVEELHSLVCIKYPGIGIATVYRTIKLMERIGLISKSNIEDIKSRYRLNNIGTSKTYRNFQDTKQDNFSVRKIHKTNSQDDYNLLSFSNMGSNYENFKDAERIKNLEKQMSIWLKDLNKLKREKEITLEDMIKDLAKIDEIIKNHSYNRSSLIQMLLDIQKECNWLPKHVLFYISDKLEIPLTNIYNIASFYKHFNLEPQGKYNILVCMGTACYVRGAMNLLQRIVNVLEVKPGDTTNDNRFTLDTVNCLGVCAVGPVMVVDDKYYTNPSTNKLKKIFSKFN